MFRDTLPARSWPTNFFEQILASSMEASTCSGVSLTWFSVILASKQNLTPKPCQNQPQALDRSIMLRKNIDTSF